LGAQASQGASGPADEESPALDWTNTPLEEKASAGVTIPEKMAGRSRP